MLALRMGTREKTLPNLETEKRDDCIRSYCHDNLFGEEEGLKGQVHSRVVFGRDRSQSQLPLLG